MLKHAPFRFLDLPKELRYMIYEKLDISTKTLQLLPLEDGLQVRQQTTDPAFNIPCTITITLQTLPIQILSTSRLIHSEALPFLTRKLSTIRSTTPRLSIDADCLYTSAMTGTQSLLCALLDTLNSHAQLASKQPQSQPRTTPTRARPPPPSFPRDLSKWLTQTSLLLLSQRPSPCPLAGFMGTSLLPRVRLVVEVPRAWRYSSPHPLASQAESVAMLPLYTGSVASRLSQLYGVLVEYSRGLRWVRGGAIVFGQEEEGEGEGEGEEREVRGEGVVVWKRVALEFGVCGRGY
ncbi:hypothetical protein SVAN01_05819 [Stagonosporopsis vannaccii]|nr:hypothetical protein SVAN01_05819 [Stagonosporopsis vannaccii]